MAQRIRPNISGQKRCVCESTLSLLCFICDVSMFCAYDQYTGVYLYGTRCLAVYLYIYIRCVYIYICIYTWMNAAPCTLSRERCGQGSFGVLEAGLNKVLEYKQSSRSDIALCVIEPFSKTTFGLAMA